MTERTIMRGYRSGNSKRQRSSENCQKRKKSALKLKKNLRYLTILRKFLRKNYPKKKFLKLLTNDVCVKYCR